MNVVTIHLIVWYLDKKCYDNFKNTNKKSLGTTLGNRSQSVSRSGPKISEPISKFLDPVLLKPNVYLRGVTADKRNWLNGVVLYFFRHVTSLSI